MKRAHLLQNAHDLPSGTVEWLQVPTQCPDPDACGVYTPCTRSTDPASSVQTYSFFTEHEGCRVMKRRLNLALVFEQIEIAAVLK